MADPYNPYTSSSMPTPGGVSYYPPEDQAYPHQQSPYPYQQQYGSGELPPDPNYPYPPQASTYHLAPEPYQGAAPERSYTPVGQPEYMGPVALAAMPPSPNPSRKIPENLGYYGHPAEQPRYSPSPSPRPPSVYVSDADNPSSHHDDKHSLNQADDSETERGVGSSLAGGAAGYFLGHKKEHGFLGALGGAILGNYLEGKMKDHGRHSHHSHGHGHGHGHEHGHHHHHHHRHRHSRSRSHSRHRGDDEL